MSSTKSLSTYKSELRTIAERNGFGGVVTEFLINMLSYAIYEDQSNVLVATNEVNPDKATDINDIIDFALSRLYSVYRGQNPILTVPMVSAVQTSIKKYDQLWTGKGFNVYSLEDRNDIRVGDKFTLKCIVAESIFTVDAEESNIDAYYIDFNLHDVSEEFVLEATETIDYNPVEVTKNIQTLMEPGEGLYYALQCTSYNYGIRFYFPDTKDSRNLQAYRIKYVPYYNKGIDAVDLKSFNINGFDIDKTKIIINQHIEREGVNDGIGEKAKMNLNALGSIRSNDDLLAIFNQMFYEKVASSSFEITGIQFNEDRTQILDQGNIIIYYVPRVGDRSLITDQEIADFKNAMLPYIPCKSSMSTDGTIITEPIKPLKIKKGEEVQYPVIVDLYLDSDIDTIEISDYLHTLERKLGTQLDIYAMMAKINSLSDAIRYNRVRVSGSNTHRYLENNQYLIWSNITINVNKVS